MPNPILNLAPFPLLVKSGIFALSQDVSWLEVLEPCIKCHQLLGGILQHKRKIKKNKYGNMGKLGRNRDNPGGVKKITFILR